jgi:hypothetical protein
MFIYGLTNFGLTATFRKTPIIFGRFSRPNIDGNKRLNIKYVDMITDINIAEIPL